MKSSNIAFIGVDVGGTKMLLQAFDKDFKLVTQERVLTETKKGSQGFVSQLIRLIESHSHPQLKAIGVALPGIVDQKKGILVKAPHLPVKNLKLLATLKKYFACEIYLENDLNAFLKAQMLRPALQKYQNVVAVMVGTGVGGALWLEGKLFSGTKGFAGEVGHMVINASGPLQTLEQNLGGFFIPQMAKKLGIKRKFQTEDLQKNDPQAKKVIQHLVENLGLGLSNLNLIFNPEVFILGGSIYTEVLKPYKVQLQKIIVQHALGGQSPRILEADEKYTPARGALID